MADGAGQRNDEQLLKRLSFVKPTDNLFFKETGPLGNLAPDSGDPGDPLAELLASAAELQVPDSLDAVGSGYFDENAPSSADWAGPKHLGSAAIVFERKESRRLSFMGSDEGGTGRKQSRRTVSDTFTLSFIHFKGL